MTGFRFWAACSSLVLLLVLTSCGGGGQGLRVGDDPVLVTSTSVPSMLSGESMSHVIPLAGGCGGPYVLKVIEGRMPDGLYLVNETQSIEGAILEDGDFEFTIQVTDAGCEPFSSTTARFTMNVGVGDITVVGATRDGNPVLIPAGGESYNPDYPSLGRVVYNDYATIELVVAGGHGPWSAVVFDDPTIPNDGPLPLGAGVPPGSVSINGAPVEVGPNGGPFLITFEITDSVGTKGYFTFYWLIETPPIIFATDAWDDGQAGVSYSQQIFVAEGVPPFAYEFVEEGLPEDYTSDKADNPDLDPNTDVIYNPGGPPDVNPPEALVKIDASYYPASNLDTTYDGVPPEGASLDEDTGSFAGIPRRYGSYTVHAHVNSTLVPNSFGQHAWGTLTFAIAQAPAIQQDPAYTLEPAFTTTPPYAAIVEAIKGEVYNPDGGPRGLQILATGGVPDDGFTDAPHRSQTATDPAETAGAYKWSVDWNPDGDFDGTPSLGVIAGMELTGLGIFRIEEVGGTPQVDDLIPQFPQAIAFTAADSALPDSLADEATEKASFGIGPDRILVTTSTTPVNSSTDNRSWDDTAMTLRYVIPQGNSHLMRPPNDGDLTGEGTDKHTLPSEVASGTTPATLFSSVDLLRVSVNPTGYWDDRLYLNPNSARPWQNTQSSFYYPYYGPGANGTTYYTGSNYAYGYQPSTACVRLPTCKDTTVAADKASGVYTDGGKLHVFDTSTHLGVFIVRQDGRIYVPAAFSKSGTGYVSMGDNWNYAYRASGSSHSGTKMPQMTVSPDGRIAAFKLRTSTTYSRTETASSTDILLISLTGERIAAWDDEVYRVVESGSTGTSSTGSYLYASSLALTNDYLYYLIGNQTTYSHYRDHFIYRYGLFGGNADDDEGELLHSNHNSQWTNASGSPMQTPFQYFGRNFATNTSTGAPDQVMYTTHGYGSWEGSMAPMPFRVNRDGNACAILAGLNTTATSASSTVLFHHVWVDFEGEMTQLSTQRRHTSGGSRGIALSHGPCYTPVKDMWNTFSGPTSRFEISDDGLKVAVVYYRNTTVDPYVSYSEYVYRYRSDIAAYVSSDNAWGNVSVREITGDSGTGTGYYTSPVSGKFPGTSSSNDTMWRFGALTFTANGDGLVFWGGYSNYDPDNYYHFYYGYTGAKSFVGTLYSYDFATSGVRNILPSTIGGSNDTVGAAQTSITFSQSSWQRDGGVIKPIAGWVSENRNFLYIVTRGAVNNSNYRDGTVLGVNIRSVNASSTSGGSSGIAINGHQDGRAFRVDGFATLNGFLATQYYAAYFGIGPYTYSSIYHGYYFQIGYNNIVGAMDNGLVYTTSCTSAGSASSSTSTYYGGCINTTYYAYPYLPKKIYVFDSNVGGDMQEVGASGWSGARYQHVQGLVVSDDGSCLSVVDSVYSSYSYPYQERLTVFSGIEAEADGDLANPVTRQVFESGTPIGDNSAFSPLLDSIYYGSGGGNTTTSTDLKVGTIGGSTTGASLGFGASRYSVIHVGR